MLFEHSQLAAVSTVRTHGLFTSSVSIQQSEAFWLDNEPIFDVSPLRSITCPFSLRALRNSALQSL